MHTSTDPKPRNGRWQTAQDLRRRGLPIDAEPGNGARFVGITVLVAVGVVVMAVWIVMAWNE